MLAERRDPADRELGRRDTFFCASALVERTSARLCSKFCAARASVCAHAEEAMGGCLRLEARHVPAPVALCSAGVMVG